MNIIKHNLPESETIQIKEGDIYRSKYNEFYIIAKIQSKSVLDYNLYKSSEHLYAAINLSTGNPFNKPTDIENCIKSTFNTSNNLVFVGRDLIITIRYIKCILNTDATLSISIEKSTVDESPETKYEAMFENMQYYMEYCKENEYVTPMEWIEKHKTF